MKRHPSGFILAIVVVALVHIGAYIGYDYYKNSGADLAYLKSKIKGTLGLLEQDQPKRQNATTKKRYIRKREPVPTVKEKPKIYSWEDSSGAMHFSDRKPNKPVKNLKVQVSNVNYFVRSASIILAGFFILITGF